MTIGTRKEKKFSAFQKHLVLEGSGDVHINNKLHQRLQLSARAKFLKVKIRDGFTEVLVFACVYKYVFHRLKRGQNNPDSIALANVHGQEIMSSVVPLQFGVVHAWLNGDIIMDEGRLKSIMPRKSVGFEESLQSV